MLTYILVFAGGGLGSICRFGIGHLLAPLRWQFPWATFIANVLSCIILGVLFSLNVKGKLGGAWSVSLMAGFCGGFSTFSTFTSETFMLLHDGEWFKALLNVFLSMTVCLLSFYLGVKSASQILN
jgi:CrcB protein